MPIGSEISGYRARDINSADRRNPGILDPQSGSVRRSDVKMSSAKARMIIRAVGFVTVIASPFWALALFYSGDYQYTSAFILIPLVVALNFVIALRITRGDPFLHQLLPIAILFKVAACGLYIFMVLNILGGGDVGGYFENGKQIASLYSITGIWSFTSPFWGTNFVNLLTGVLLLLIGPSLPAASVIFGLLSFWGEFFFYRAFCAAFPRGDRYLFGVLVFLFPSIVFWPATIGKDAVIMFFIGLSVFGFALVNARGGPKAYSYLGLGLFGAMLVRPHISSMLVISMTVPYLIVSNRRGAAGFLGKMVGVGILAASTYLLTNEAKIFLNVDDLNSGARVINDINKNNRYGPAAFGKEESFAAKTIAAPVLLFRPFIWEVHNLPSAFASIEGFLLLLFAWHRRKQIIALVRSWRVDSFAAFLLIYTVQFSVIFAGAMSNFGLLVRQRVMLLPFALMLVTASSLQWHRRRAEDRFARSFPSAGPSAGSA